MTVDEKIKAHVLETLENTSSRKEAIKILGICEKTLRNYLHKWKREDLIGPCYSKKKDRYYYPNPSFKERERMQNWNGEEKTIPQKIDRRVHE